MKKYFFEKLQPGESQIVDKTIGQATAAVYAHEKRHGGLFVCSRFRSKVKIERIK